MLILHVCSCNTCTHKCHNLFINKTFSNSMVDTEMSRAEKNETPKLSHFIFCFVYRTQSLISIIPEINPCSWNLNHPQFLNPNTDNNGGFFRGQSWIWISWFLSARSFYSFQTFLFSTHDFLLFSQNVFYFLNER